ncbi:MAG: hypothetical protein IJO09_01900 [Oscillospiraceae bacterium]|nr:hypothetical protein [Oscillospiraceae bacterium]
MDVENKMNKEKAYDLIQKHYFERNFGMMSKTDFETLLFHIYIETLLDNQQPFDDYTISKALGISQSKVRTLKVRKELQYPRKGFKWKNAFAEDVCNASFDNNSKMIKMMVSDVNVLTELRYFMEINGWYDEYQLNPRLFQCRLDFFIELCDRLSEEDVQINDEAERKLRELECKQENDSEKNAIQKILEGSMSEGLKSLTLTASKDLMTTVLNALPFGGIAKTMVGYLVDVIKRS